MPLDPDQYDFFVSYARRDNADGWISGFVDELLAEHRKFTGGRELVSFFDKEDIRSLDDWRQRLYHGLATSRLFLAFISPHYFASQWCRREWLTWIDLEIAKHILSVGAAPVYIVEVPGLLGQVEEQHVARQVAELCELPAPQDAFVESASPLVHQLRRRQLSKVQPFYRSGISALREDDLRQVLEKLARDLDERVEQVRRAAVSLSTVPPYNKNFSGRLDELLDLRERLKDDRAGVISGIHGLGGVGKTELAFTYAHAFAGAYPGGRFMIECEGKATLQEAVLTTGEFTQLEFIRDGISDEERMQPDTYFAAILRCLRQRLDESGHILLVLDNVTEPALLESQHTDQLTSLGPKLHLLATTRLPTGAGRHVAWVTLGELPEADSLALLEKHRPFADEGEREAGRSIVRRLGGFALAVELMAAWLAAHQEVSYAGMLERLGLEELDTLDALAEGSEGELRRHNHERRLEAVLWPTLTRLSDVERRALEYAAFLPPDHVPLPWLRELVAKDFPNVVTEPRPGYPDPWEGLCRRLVGLALLSRAEGQGHRPRVVRVHRLVQDVVRRGLSPDGLLRRQRAIDALVHKRDSALGQSTRWEEARWEVEPLDALANLWADNACTDAAWLLNQAGLRWEALAEHARAEPLMRRALAIDEAAFGAEHTRVATYLNNLAQLLQDTNRLAEAEPMLRRALAIAEASLGVEHPNVAIYLNNLAQLLQATNRLAEAEPMMRRALAIDEAAFGAKHPSVAIDLNNLAQLLQAINRLAEAEPLMRRALAIDEAFFGAEHPNVARDLSNLAQLLQDTNRLAEAEPMLRRALAIDEACFGAEHPKVAVVLNNLAQLLQDTNRLAEAEPLMARVVTTLEKAFGVGHPKVATALNNLAGFLKATNRLAEAESPYRRALAIDEACFGAEHPKVAVVLNNLAQLLQDTNRLAEAEPMLRRALAIDEAAFGAEHPSVAIRLNNLAQLLADTNRLAEAEPLMRRALAIDEASLGDEHPSVAIRLNNLAQLLADTNRLAEAEPLMRRALAIDEASLGDEHPTVARDLNNLAQLLEATGRLAEAEPMLRRALAIDEAALGGEHPKVAIRLNNLASLLLANQRQAESEPMMRRAMDILTASLGDDHPNTMTVRENYRLLCEQMG